jgi:predicted DNA-binding protein (MmcQ/YjbR family)
MNIESLREFCLSKPYATECLPFDDVTLVFKVMNKMFAIIPTDEVELSISLKCNPDRAIELREHYPSIVPGFHLNKQHWNTVKVDGSISDKLIKELVDHSYSLIVNSLPKKVRDTM